MFPEYLINYTNRKDFPFVVAFRGVACAYFSHRDAAEQFCTSR